MLGWHRSSLSGCEFGMAACEAVTLPYASLRLRNYSESVEIWVFDATPQEEITQEEITLYDFW